MRRIKFNRVDGVSMESQVHRALNKEGIDCIRDAGGLKADLGDGLVYIDYRLVSGDKYMIVPKERNRRWWVGFTSMWGGAEQIRSFDTFSEANWFREQVHGRILAW